jgi:hypothetical protein
MTAVATRERGVRQRDSGSDEPPAKRLFEPEGPTLEDAILAAWEELASGDRATCPVCSREMSRASGCNGCGSQLT